MCNDILSHKETFRPRWWLQWWILLKNKEETISNLYTIYQKQTKKHIPNIFYRPELTLTNIFKRQKYYEKELYYKNKNIGNYSSWIQTNVLKNSSKSNMRGNKKYNALCPNEVHPENVCWLKIWKWINVIHHSNRRKKQN